MKHMYRLLLLIGMLMLPVIAAPANADGFARTPGGVAYRELQVGSGRAVQTGDAVTVHLVGWVNGQAGPERAFFNTHSESRPLQFLVGTPRVLQGWNEGVRGMRPGGRRLLKIPPSQGLGARAFEDSVPANATLVFIVELLDVCPGAQ